MISIVTGDEAKRIERLDIEKVKDEIHEVLKGVYGKKASRPIEAHVAKWDTDPRFCGSFSFLGTNAFKDDNFDDLCKPVNDKIFFAGEAFDPKYSAYLHGAYLSGEKTANDMLNLIQ